MRLLFGAYLLALSAAAAAQNAVTTHSVRVYAGPDDSYPLVARLDADVPVQVMGCLDDWSWCDVAFEDNRGWLYAPDITYEYESGYVPLYTYAPSLGIPVVEFTIGDYWERYYHGRPWYAEREEWEHRGPPHHHRPPGPPPSAGPPPRSARMDRPPHEAQRERPLRLGSAGSAEPPHREAEHAVSPHEEHAAREEHPAVHEERPSQEHPAERAEPPRHEERSQRPEESQRAEGARHDERPHEGKPGDHPNDSPH